MFFFLARPDCLLSMALVATGFLFIMGLETVPLRCGDLNAAGFVQTVRAGNLLRMRFRTI